MGRLCFLILGYFLFQSELLYAKPVSWVKINPINSIEYIDQGALRLKFDVPCGLDFYGVLADINKNGQILLGAAMTGGDIVCTGLPQPMEITVSFLSHAAREVLSMPAGVARLRVAPLSDLRLVATQTDAPKLKAVYKKCGAYAGVLIRQDGKQLEVSFAERVRRMQARKSCSSQMLKQDIEVIDLRSAFNVTGLNQETSKQVRSLQLKLIPITRDQVSFLPQQGIEVRYARSCQEAPVGLVIEAIKDNKELKLGMLVANYDHFPCQRWFPGQKEAFWQAKELRLPRDYTVGPLESDHDLRKTTLTLQQPLSLAHHPEQNSLHIKYLASCRSRLGVVYGRDAFGSLAAGVLTMQRSSPCKTEPVAVTLFQPFASQGNVLVNLFPMQLKGWAAQ